MFKRSLFAVFLFIVNTSTAQLSPKFDSLFNSFHTKGLFDGTVLIADSSGILYHHSFGIANHDYGVPNDTATVFRLGSLEKQFTAMLVLQLVEMGKLSLNKTIHHYLPKYRKETGNKVTIKYLLTHRSGIPNYTALPNVWNDSLRLPYQPEYILRTFCSGDLEFQPGTKYKYSNTNYFILAQVLEQVTGKPLSVLLKENIFLPTGMSQTGLEDHIDIQPNKAYGYYRIAETYINEPFIHVPNTKGAASIYSTAYDMYLWDRILYTNKLLSSEWLKQYCSPQVTIGPDYSCGFGWEFSHTAISDNDTVYTMQHSGAIRAFRALMFRIPAEKKCVILLSNSANESGYELFENIMKIFRGRIWEEPRKLLADTLYTIIQKASVKEAIQSFKNLRNNDSIMFDFGSSSLELLGERLLLKQSYEEAVAIFKLAVEVNPNYTYGYFYLGKALEKQGKISEAINAYQTAVLKDKNSRPGIDAAFQIKHLIKQM